MSAISTKKDDNELLEAIKNLTSMIEELIMTNEALNGTMTDILEKDLTEEE